MSFPPILCLLSISERIIERIRFEEATQSRVDKNELQTK